MFEDLLSTCVARFLKTKTNKINNTAQRAPLAGDHTDRRRPAGYVLGMCWYVLVFSECCGDILEICWRCFWHCNLHVLGNVFGRVVDDSPNIIVDQPPLCLTICRDVLFCCDEADTQGRRDSSQAQSCSQKAAQYRACCGRSSQAKACATCGTTCATCATCGTCGTSCATCSGCRYSGPATRSTRANPGTSRRPSRFELFGGFYRLLLNRLNMVIAVEFRLDSIWLASKSFRSALLFCEVVS